MFRSGRLGHRRRVLKIPSREVATFLAVGAAGYVTDVVAFNWLRDQPVLGGGDPLGAKVAAVAIAMVVTYVGNRMLTWRDLATSNQRREVVLFAVFNVVGLLISIATLYVTHDVLGLTNRLEDNLSGNVLGVGLGTAFRYWAYKRYVFVGDRRANRRTTRNATKSSTTAAVSASPPPVR